MVPGGLEARMSRLCYSQKPLFLASCNGGKVATVFKRMKELGDSLQDDKQFSMHSNIDPPA